MPNGMPCQNTIERIPATLKTSEKAMKYHFLLRKSIFGLRKNSTLNNPSVVRPWSCVVRLEPSPAVSSLFRLGTGQTARDVRRVFKYSALRRHACGSAPSQKSHAKQ